MKEKRKVGVRLLAALLAVCMAFSYAPGVDAAKKKGGKVKNVTVSNLPSNTLTLAKGKSLTLKVKVTGSGKVSQAVVFQSNTPKVVSVTAKGKVTAKKSGSAKITITSKADRKKKTTVTVKVGTPVKSVTVKKPGSTTIMAGQTLKLKAKVSPSKASNKKIVWTSSKPKVAKVNASGKVTGVSAGTAWITAEAADGSGKQKRVKITVKQTNGIASMAVLNASTVQVKLKDAQKLALSNFTVKVNSSGKGSYNKLCRLDNIATSDNKTYLLVLDADNPIYNQENVEVTIKGLRGVKTASRRASYSIGTFKYTGYVTYSDIYYNETVSEYYEFGGYGYSAYTVANLPKGIKSEQVGNSIHFYGKAQQKGRVASTLQTRDEIGNTYTYSIIWLIGSDDTIAASASPAYLSLGADGQVYVDLQVRARGGSGSYTYSLTGNTYNLQINEYGEITGTLLAPGTYRLTAVVADATAPARKTTASVVINVARTISVSGVVKDMLGNPIPYADVTFSNKDRANKYTLNRYTECDDKGAFSATLVAGRYDIEASRYGSHRYLYAQALSTTRSGFDITLPVQRVVIYSNNSAVNPENFGTWYDEKGNSYGSGNIVWLKRGKHVLTTTTEMGRRTVTATLNVNVTVSTTTATAAVKISELPSNGTVTAETPLNISLSYDNKYYVFKPTVTGTYYFWTETDSYSYTYGRLEDENGEYLTSDEGSITNDNFYFSYRCEAGKTYYIRISNDEGTMAGKLYVSSMRRNNGTVTAETPLDISLSYSNKYYVFKPTATGTYYFWTETDSYSCTYGCLEDENGEYLTSDGDSITNGNFYFSYACEAGKTYYIGVSNEEDTMAGKLCVSATQPSFGDYEDEYYAPDTAEDAELMTEETKPEDAAGETEPEETVEEASSEDAAGETEPEETVEEAASEDAAGETEPEETVEETAPEETDVSGQESGYEAPSLP